MHARTHIHSATLLLKDLMCKGFPLFPGRQDTPDLTQGVIYGWNVRKDIYSFQIDKVALCEINWLFSLDQ